MKFRFCFFCLLWLLVLTPGFAADNPVLLNKIILTGLKQTSTEEALKSLSIMEKQAFEPEQIQVIKQELSAFFQTRGYYLARISQPQIIPVSPTQINLEFVIEEGSLSEIKSLSFTGNRYFSTSKLKTLLDYTEGKILTWDKLPALQNRIMSLYTTRGYLFCNVKLDTLQALDTGFSAVIRIEEGPLFKATNFLFNGNKVTRPNTILHISGLGQVKQITPEVLIQAENNLLRKPYIKTCQIIPLNQNTLQINLEESRMTRLEGVLGLATNRVTDKQELNGYVNVQFMNLWGTDRALNLTWRSLQSRYQLLRLAYHESGWLRYPFAGDLAFQREKQDSLWIKLKAETALYYRMLYSKTGLEFYTESLYPGSDSPTAITQTDYKKAGVFWDYQKLDYARNPSRGFSFLLRYGWVFSASDAGEKITPGTEIDLGAYFPLREKLVLAAAVHGRQISDSQAKSHEQYKMGGFGTLRGYSEDEFSSWRLGWINTELRYLLTSDSRLFILFDSGYLQVSEDKLKTDLFALGGGISFSTKLGVFSLSYALSYTDKRLSDVGSGMLHLGLDSSL